VVFGRVFPRFFRKFVGKRKGAMLAKQMTFDQ
jgi:hypothetical protein